MKFFIMVLIALSLVTLTFASYNDYYLSLESQLENENPAIVMQKYKSLSAKSKQLGDFMLPDLETSTMIMNDGYGITISQMIPFPTKIYSKSRELNNNFKASIAEYNLVKSQIKSEFKFYYISLYFLINKINILNNNLQIIEHLTSQINSQVISGKASVTKLLSIQIEKEKLQDTIQRAETEKRNFINALISLFDNEIGEGKLIQSIQNSDIKEYNFDLSDDDIKILITQSALYKMKEFEKEQTRYKKQLKYNNFLPDMMVETEYMSKVQDSSLRDISFMFSLKIPITVFKRSGELSEINKLYNARKASVKNIYNTIKKNLMITAENYKMNKRSYNTYKNTLRKTADQNFAEVQSKYITSNEVSAVDFLEAFRKLLDIDLMALKFKVEMEKNIIMLEKITTKNIDNIQKLNIN